jgi:hypothetical protein
VHRLKLDEHAQGKVNRASELIKRTLTEIGAMTWMDGRPIAYTSWPDRSASADLATNIWQLANQLTTPGSGLGDA